MVVIVCGVLLNAAQACLAQLRSLAVPEGSSAPAVGLLLSPCSCLWRSVEVLPDQVELFTLFWHCPVHWKLPGRGGAAQAPILPEASDSDLELSQAISLLV